MNTINWRMPKINKIAFWLLLPFFAILFTQCEKQKDFKYVPSPPNEKLDVNAWDFIQQNESFSILKGAIEIAGLQDKYMAPDDSKTFILPKDAAFQTYLSDNGYTSVSDIPKPILRYVLLYHIIDKKILSGDTALVKTDPIPYETENGQLMYISHNNNYQLEINKGTNRSWTIEVSNLQAINGAMEVSPAVVFYSANVPPPVEDDNLERDTIYAIQDSYVNGGNLRDQNYSNEVLIKVKNVGEDVEGGVYDRRAYMMFDLKDIKKSGVVRNAFVEVGVSFTAAKNISLDLYNVPDNNWSESSLTWANAPEEDPNPIASIISSKITSFRWDVKDYFTEKMENPGLITLKINAQAGSDETDEFFSHRNSNNLGPRLMVVFSSGVSNLSMGTNNPMTVQQGGIGVFDDSMLLMEGASHGDIIYTIESLPADGWLINGTRILKVGDSFTQLDIDLLNLVYIHNGESSSDDEFTVSVRDPDGGAIDPFDFHINIQ